MIRIFFPEKNKVIKELLPPSTKSAKPQRLNGILPILQRPRDSNAYWIVQGSDNKGNCLKPVYETSVTYAPTPDKVCTRLQICRTTSPVNICWKTEKLLSNTLANRNQKNILKIMRNHDQVKYFQKHKKSY